MTTDVRSFLHRYAPMIYGPTTLFAVGKGAVIPIVPLIAVELGANLAVAALVTGALVIGQLVGNIPAGWIIARSGERVTMALSGAVALIGVFGMALSMNMYLFAVSVFLVGFCSAAFNIARHAFMTRRVPIAFRARSLSILGGVYRFGVFVGPFLGAGLIWMFGGNRAVFWWFAICLAGAVVLVWFGPDPERIAEPSFKDVRTPKTGVIRTIGKHRGVLLRVGVAAASMSSIRAARQVVLPLWGATIGLDSSTILIIVGFSGAIDFALFYLSGQVMDRYGRLWAALPAMITMGLGFIILAFTETSLWFVICAVIIGLGNGLSSGILMTLGADLSPQEDPAAFLGAWHTLTDGGSAATPIIFSGIVAVASINVGTAVLGAIALLGAWGFAYWVPKYSKHR